ncbi:hypothetical protein [Sulfurimonas sp.]|uniref:hypothetical protein n=1 Tax=Sulfurimonas sp. TaxID=2022749 RepID=UPI003D0A1A60
MNAQNNFALFVRKANTLLEMQTHLAEYENHLEQEAAFLQQSNQKVNDQSFSCAALTFDPSSSTNKHLLLLGGMGPLAGIYGMRDTLKQVDSSFSITLFQACFIPQRDLKTDITQPLFEAILEALKYCPKDKNIELIVLCNSAQVFMNDVVEKINTSSLNIRFHSFKHNISKQQNIFKSKKSIALQTSFSLHNQLYKNEHFHPFDYQELLMKAIGSVKAFKKNQAIQNAIELFKVLKNTNTQKILLGCTEIPVLVEYIKNFGDEEMQQYISSVELINPLHVTLQSLGNQV